MERWLKAKQDRVWCGSRILELEKHWDTSPEHDILMKKVASLIIGNSVLDVGCGVGHLSEYVHNVQYLGVDQSADMLNRARSRYPNVKFIQQNIYDLNLPNFDTVVCLDVLHHQLSLEPAFSILLTKAKKCLIVTLWINGRDKERRSQSIDSWEEITSWYTEKELENKFSGLNYKVHKGVGHVWRDVYRFFK